MSEPLGFPQIIFTVISALVLVASVMGSITTYAEGNYKMSVQCLFALLCVLIFQAILIAGGWYSS